MPTQRIQRKHAGLLVVDVQERLLPAIGEAARLVENVIRLIKGATILDLPIFVTEQYRKGLGPTVPEITQAVPGFAPFHKSTFSACGAEGLLNALNQKKVSHVIICGIEAHVCVWQSCLDLLSQGMKVYVVADAVSSRTHENRQIGLDRMRDVDAVIVSAEMILFELLEQVSTEEF